MFEEYRGYKIEIKQVEVLKEPHYTGYIYLNRHNIYYGLDYDSIDINIHGGWTFTEEINNQWIIGFDTAHLGDNVPEIQNTEYIRSQLHKAVDDIINEQLNFKEYQRTNIAEMRPVRLEETIKDNPDISISAEDRRNGSPRLGNMIARNPKNYNDMWLVNEQYFKDNFKRKIDE